MKWKRRREGWEESGEDGVESQGARKEHVCEIGLSKTRKKESI